MRKVLLLLGGVVVLLAIGWYFVYTHPKHIDSSISGVEYRAGNPNEGIKHVAIQAKGTLQKSIRGTLTFVGTIKVSGATQPNPENSRTLTIHFNNSGGYGVMAYGWYVNGKGFTREYGLIFTNHNFTEVTILENNTLWTATNGLTIAAPASTRSKAISISNSLMKGWLNGNALK